jgi:hypothetical protein
MKNQVLVTLAMVCVNIHECILEHRAKHCELTLANRYFDIGWFHQWHRPCGGPFLFLSLVPCVWVKKVAKLCKVVARIENKLESRQDCACSCMLTCVFSFFLSHKHAINLNLFASKLSSTKTRICLVLEEWRDQAELCKSTTDCLDSKEQNIFP